MGSVQSTQQVAYSVVAKSTSGESRTIVYLDSAANNWNLTGTFPAHIPLNPPDVCSLDVPWEGALPTDTVAVLVRSSLYPTSPQISFGTKTLLELLIQD